VRERVDSAHQSRAAPALGARSRAPRHLAVNDTTLSNETGVHSLSVTQPIKIVNDLP
jgi:hypothetical protein